jgi:hypothetical protein
VSIRDNFKAQESNRQHYQSGELTALDFHRLEQVYLRSIMPKQLPSGAPLNERFMRNFVEHCRIELLPCIAVEMAVSRDAWIHNRALTDRAFRDLQHVIAVPYVDYFVTNDLTMTSVLHRVLPRMPFRFATIIDKSQFDAHFL